MTSSTMFQACFLLIAFIFSVTMNLSFQVHGVGHNIFADNPISRPQFSPRRAQQLQEQDRADARRGDIEKALKHSKTGRYYTPRRERVSDQDRRRYDVHRNSEFKSAAAVDLAHLALSQKLKENATPEEKHEHQMLKYHAGQSILTGRVLQDYHNKAANRLLPEHLRDEHVYRHH